MWSKMSHERWNCAKNSHYEKDKPTCNVMILIKFPRSENLNFSLPEDVLKWLNHNKLFGKHAFKNFKTDIILINSNNGLRSQQEEI